MISLRKLWMADEPIDAGAARRVVQLLLQGIALHAVEGDHQDYLAFRQDMQGLLDKVQADLSPAGLLVYTGVTLKTLEDYNHRTTRYVRAQGLNCKT